VNSITLKTHGSYHFFLGLLSIASARTWGTYWVLRAATEPFGTRRHYGCANKYARPPSRRYFRLANDETRTLKATVFTIFSR